VASASTTRAQQPSGAAAASGTFMVFLASSPIGTEDITVVRSADGWTITSVGRIGPPIDVLDRRFEAKYDADWKPVELTIDAVVRNQEQGLHTTISGTTISTEATIAGQTRAFTAMAAVDLFLPNPIFAAYEAVTQKARTSPAGTMLSVLVNGQVTGTMRLGDSATERIATVRQTIEAKRTHVSLSPGIPGAPMVEADVWGDADGYLLRISVPAERIDVMRDDLAATTTRQVAASRPNDEQVKMQGAGLLLAGTLSKPEGASSRLPAVILVGGTGPTDRDELVFGVPIIGELANSLADAGFLTLRYDKRGIGLSGGRSESATIEDYAEDIRAAIKFLSARADVDPKRIAVIGYSEGAAAALTAAAQDKRIVGVAVMAASGIRGSEFVLEQQQRALGRLNLSDAERQSRIDQQKQLDEAVLTGKGWDKFNPAVRRQVDTGEFQSLLLYDPAKVVPKVHQPVLIVQGMLDTQVAPVNADRLADLARARKNAGGVHVQKLAGINHLLVPAQTGEADEYATLRDKHVGAAVTTAVIEWLQITLK